MSAEKPVGTPSGSSADSPKTSDLSGLTEAIGGLEPAVPDRDPLIGSVIGGVTIIRLIAEGGMGRVYEGLQSKPRRPVAVKVMRPGFVSRDASRRFDLESEVLGRLRHQYIAQIYSAGMCNIVGAQVPYFVMEFIPDAMPLTKFASEKKLSTDERIELFRKVCEAVAHGHERGIVHRDLKPSNILVEPSGTPQIIDFGVARCIDASAEAQTNLTDMGQLIGTLQYMSPEQLDASPNAIDKRTDVYALGVILYELITGKPPYEISKKEILEAARVIREQKPLSPSRLNQNVQPDVVRITGRCLQKDRRNRYNNAAELAHALGEYLGGRPVLDSSPSPFKGSRRRLGLLLSAGAMTTLAAILLVAFLMPGRTALRSGPSASESGAAAQLESPSKSPEGSSLPGTTHNSNAATPEMTAGSGTATKQTKAVGERPKSPRSLDSPLPPPLTDGLVLHWTFDDDSSAKVIDAGPSHNDGVPKGAKWQAKGLRGGCMSFDGYEDYITAGADDSLLMKYGALTFSAWAKPTTGGRIICKRAAEARDYICDLTPKGAGFDYFDASYMPYGDTEIGFTAPLDLDEQWHHVAWTVSPRQQCFYLDGQLQAEKKLKYRLPQHAAFEVWVGGDPALGTRNTWMYGGLLDEVMLWNRPLSPSEIAELAVLDNAQPQSSQSVDSETHGRPPTLTNSIGMTLIEIPAGTFLMGTPSDEPGHENNEQQVSVTISKPYWIGQTEVTQAQWKRVMGSTPWVEPSTQADESDHVRSWVKSDPRSAASYIRWSEAVSFCRELTFIERKAGLIPDTVRYALPTEAQWEYACRAGSKTRFSFGDSIALLSEYAWWGYEAGRGNCLSAPHVHIVGALKPNPWGLHDIHGNVWEWCSDWAGNSLAGGVDPQGPDTGTLRIIRGGDWSMAETCCRSGCRGVSEPEFLTHSWGLRVVRIDESVASMTSRKPETALGTETNSIGITLIKIPAGDFVMGSPETDPERIENEKQVTVTISQPFLMSSTEVTQAQWRQIMNTEPWSNIAGAREGNTFPVCNINWDEANDFCTRLTVMERAAGKISEQVSYSLPTEAQWEYACRAGTTTTYSCGSDEGTLSDYSWYTRTTLDSRHIHEVATKKPNPWGLYDMPGNVWEWCRDFSIKNPDAPGLIAAPLVEGTDPTGPENGDGRIFRGGGWDYWANCVRSARRDVAAPTHRFVNGGFRVVRNVTKE